MPEINFNLLNPSAELYSGPQVQMDPVAAYEKAKATRQSNMLAQLYAKHYDPQTGGVNYNALIGEAAQTGLNEAIPSIMGEAQKQAKSQADIAQTQALQRQQEAAAGKYQQEQKQAEMLQHAKESYMRLQNVSTPDQFWAWHLSNPELPGVDKESLSADILQQISTPEGFQKALNASKQALESITGYKPEKAEDTGPKLGTYQPGDYTTASWAKFITSKNPADLVAKKTAAEIAAATAGTTQIPKLKQGERWNPDLERVEQVPGSVEYNKQSKLHATDYSSLDTVKSTTKANVENVDELLKAANAWATETNNGAKPLGSNASEDAKAFANLFPGSYTGYVTQYKSGATSTLKAKYQKLQSNAKNLGLQQTRVGGSIGTITEREWPMLQQQVLSLSPTMETAAAAAEIANIKNRFIDTQNLAADKYDTQWGETQYYKGAPATSAENNQIKNEAIKAFKSYEPDKYEYRINPSTGKVQRKAK